MKKKMEWYVIQGFFDGRLDSVYLDLPDGYQVRMGLERDLDGVLSCKEFEIKFNGKGNPSAYLSSTYVQRLPFGKLLAGAKETYVEYGDIVEDIQTEMEVERILETWTKTGPVPLEDKYYAAMAFMYVKQVSLGLDNPIAALVEVLKEERATISSRVMEARARGLLTKPKQGTFGGKLTPKALKLLDIKGGK